MSRRTSRGLLQLPYATVANFIQFCLEIVGIFIVLQLVNYDMLNKM